MTFKETGLGPEILQALDELGFENPTPIQERSIPMILSSDRDLIALAQTGTGKTAAFSLPVLEQIDADLKQVQCIVLCPTRELCMQITKDIESYSRFMKKVSTIAVYGGSSIDTQIRALRSGAQIVVGTPGRVIDLIKRRKLHLDSIKWLVLDEADEMLNMGFKDDLDTILAETPAERQTLLFSATMPNEIVGLTRRYMKDPETIEMAKRNMAAENVQHICYVVNARDRYNALKRVADMNPDIYGIVFCRTRRETQEVADKLIQDGYNADSLHGDLSQAQRDLVMGRFRKKQLQMLVATDVAARGLDVNDITHVINYNLPDDIEVYVHRSGRTGRAGKSGISIAIVHSRETNKIRTLERKINRKFEQQDVPTGKDICSVQLLHVMDELVKTKVNEKDIAEYLPAINEKLEHLSREDLIKRLVSERFDRFLSYYSKAPDLSAKGSRDRDDRDSDRGDRRGRDSYNFSRFHLNIGKKNQLNAARLIGLINESTRTQGIEIGKIDIMNTVSFFEIDENHAKELMDGFKNVTFEGENVTIEPAQSSGGRESSSERPHKKKSFRGGGGGRSGGGSGFGSFDKKDRFGKKKSSGSGSKGRSSSGGGNRGGGFSGGSSKSGGAGKKRRSDW